MRRHFSFVNWALFFLCHDRFAGRIDDIWKASGISSMPPFNSMHIWWLLQVARYIPNLYIRYGHMHAPIRVRHISEYWRAAAAIWTRRNACIGLVAIAHRRRSTYTHHASQTRSLRQTFVALARTNSLNWKFATRSSSHSFGARVSTSCLCEATA